MEKLIYLRRNDYFTFSVGVLYLLKLIDDEPKLNLLKIYTLRSYWCKIKTSQTAKMKLLNRSISLTSLTFNNALIFVMKIQHTGN